MEIPVFNHTAHKRMWDYIVDYLSECKNQGIPYEFNNISDLKYHIRYAIMQCECISNECFACDYAESQRSCLSPLCKSCPFELTRTNDTGNCLDGVYHKFGGYMYSACSSCDISDFDNAINLAKQIRDWPVKSGIKCK